MYVAQLHFTQTLTTKIAGELGVRATRVLRMDLDEFCERIKKQYPEISDKADTEYDKYWNSIVKMEFSSYSWFESLANALNSEMKKKVSIEKYRSLLETVSKEYKVGVDEVKKAIDVAFVENLFWQVSASDASIYWEALPKNLQDLYVGFHSRAPL